MNKALLPFILSAATLSLACSGAPSSDATTDEGALEQSGAMNGAHADAIKKCEDAYNNAAPDRAAMAIEQNELQRSDCLTKANDDAVASLESALSSGESRYAGSVKKSFADFRASSEALCTEEDNAANDFGGENAKQDGLVCRSEREALLGRLIDDFAARGTKIAEDRKNHAKCYAAYDAAMQSGGNDQASVAAGFDLANCVIKDVFLMIPTLGLKETNNSSDYGPIPTANDRIEKVVNAAMQATSPLCSALDDVGGGAGSEARLADGPCGARVAEAIFVAFTSVTAD